MTSDRRSALSGVADCLACPLCRASLALASGAVRCENGHSFDIAKQGYVSFLVGRAPHTGDTAEMVEARDRFLRGGHYDPIAAAVSDAVSTSAGLVVDVAAGTGFYLNRVLDAYPDAAGLALDVSVAAARRSARAHERAASVTADAWGALPVKDGVAGAVLNVFGPRNGSELARILRSDGVVVVVTPGTDHLRELRDRFGMIAIRDEKDARLEAQLAPLRLRERRALDYELSLAPDEVLDLVFMGPSAFHLDRASVASQLANHTLSVTVSVSVSLFA